MLTDRAPFEYTYLSRRLLTNLMEQDEATRKSRRRKTLSVDLRVASLQIDPPDASSQTMIAFAKRSADLVSDHTGDLWDPGYYVRDQTRLRHGVLKPLMGWRGGEVACYLGDVATESSGRVIVALFGSASNLIGYRPEQKGERYHPSDVMGLYTLLDVIRERGDPEIDLEYRFDDASMAAVARAETAVHLAEMGAGHDLGELDFLARIYLDVENVPVGDHSEVARVLMGTPMWVSTPRPRQLRR